MLAKADLRVGSSLGGMNMPSRKIGSSSGLELNRRFITRRDLVFDCIDGNMESFAGIR